MNISEELIAFIEESPTCFQAVDAAMRRLEEQGFRRLYEGEAWELAPGGRYMVERNQSSLIAFRVPAEPAAGFQIGAAHSDSPSFRVKPKAEITVDGKYIKLDTEPYGGGLYATWTDRPLSVAGRVTVETPQGLEPRLVCVDRDLLVIPQVAIHMNRKANEGTAYNANADMMPLFSSEAGKDGFLKAVAEAADVQPEQILGTDLFLYNRTPGTIWGQDGEFVSAPRLDDLQCAFALLKGFLEAEEPTGMVPVYALFDNEEVGSLSRQGADSTFLEDTLRRIAARTGMCGNALPEAAHETGVSQAKAESSDGYEKYLRMLAHSFLVSADNAHAVHPNHPEYSDQLNRVYMNHGIVIKYNGNLKYTSDGVSEAVFRTCCRQAGAEVQTYANRSDLPGGSTLGNLSNRHVSLRAVDIGLPQLAMHSCYETAGAKDTEDLIRVMRLYYGKTIRTERDGVIRI